MARMFERGESFGDTFPAPRGYRGVGRSFLEGKSALFTKRNLLRMPGEGGVARGGEGAAAAAAAPIASVRDVEYEEKAELLSHEISKVIDARYPAIKIFLKSYREKEALVNSLEDGDERRDGLIADRDLAYQALLAAEKEAVDSLFANMYAAIRCEVKDFDSQDIRAKIFDGEELRPGFGEDDRGYFQGVADWEDNLRDAFFEKFVFAADSGNFEYLKKFCLAVFGAAFYASRDEDGVVVEDDADLRSRFAKIRGMADLEDCAGGAGGALESYMDKLKGSGTVWNGICDILERDILVDYCRRDVEAHIPGWLKYVMGSPGGDEMLYYFPASLTMNDQRHILKSLMVNGGGFAIEFLTKEVVKIIVDASLEADSNMRRNKRGIWLEDGRDSSSWEEVFWRVLEEGIKGSVYQDIKELGAFDLQEIFRGVDVAKADSVAIYDVKDRVKSCFMNKVMMEYDKLRAIGDQDYIFDIIIDLNCYLSRNRPVPIWLRDRALAILQRKGWAPIDAKESDEDKEGFIVESLDKICDRLRSDFNINIRLLRAMDESGAWVVKFCRKKVREADEDPLGNLRMLLDVGASYDEISAEMDRVTGKGIVVGDKGLISLRGLLFHPQFCEIYDDLIKEFQFDHLGLFYGAVAMGDNVAMRHISVKKFVLDGDESDEVVMVRWAMDVLAERGRSFNTNFANLRFFIESVRDPVFGKDEAGAVGFYHFICAIFDLTHERELVRDSGNMVRVSDLAWLLRSQGNAQEIIEWLSGIFNKEAVYSMFLCGDDPVQNNEVMKALMLPHKKKLLHYFVTRVCWGLPRDDIAKEGGILPEVQKYYKAFGDDYLIDSCGRDILVFCSNYGDGDAALKLAYEYQKEDNLIGGRNLEEACLFFKRAWEFGARSVEVLCEIAKFDDVGSMLIFVEDWDKMKDNFIAKYHEGGVDFEFILEALGKFKSYCDSKNEFLIVECENLYFELGKARANYGDRSEADVPGLEREIAENKGKAYFWVDRSCWAEICEEEIREVLRREDVALAAGGAIGVEGVAALGLSGDVSRGGEERDGRDG